MKVYVVEAGCYAESYVQGVYDSPEAAMAANPVEREGVNKGYGSVERPGGWQDGPYGWSNGLDWEDACRISEYEVRTLDVASQMGSDHG